MKQSIFIFNSLNLSLIINPLLYVKLVKLLLYYFNKKLKVITLIFSAMSDKINIR